MRLLFAPIVFGMIVFYTFALPQFVDAQSHVAKLVHIATSGR